MFHRKRRGEGTPPYNISSGAVELVGAVTNRPLFESFFAAVSVAKNTLQSASVPAGRAQRTEKGVYGGKPVSTFKGF